MIKQIIFDVDGTLVDSLDTFMKIGNEIAVKHKYKPVTEEQVRELLLLPMNKRIKKLGIPMYHIPFLSIELLKRFNAYAHQLKPFDGIKDALEQLHKQGIGLNIISSNSVSNIKAFLKGNDLNMFDNISSSRGLFGKHITIGKFLSNMGVNKEEVIYIGDEQRDIEACKKIGIKVIAVLWGFDSFELLKKTNPDYIIDKPSQIIDIIAG